MRQAIPYLIAEIVLSVLIALLVNNPSNDSFLTILGLINLILGVIGLIFGTFFSIIRKVNISKGLLIASALLLLLGFLTCTMFPMKFNH